MSKFPKISNISDLEPFIKDNPLFNIKPQDNGTTVVCYSLQTADTFAGPNQEFKRECRGITFNTQTGLILSRTLHKFHNVGESEETSIENIPWSDIYRIMDKRDGSMVTPVLRIGENIPIENVQSFNFKTKKTFTSAEAIAACETLNKYAGGHAWILSMLKNGFTPTFEFTSPKFPIVITYAEDELTLLQLRNNVTGEYFEIDNLDCPFPIVKNLLVSPENELPDQVKANPSELIKLSQTVEGIEGWIVQAKNGHMWKIKTQWYINLHRSVTFTRWRDIARCVVDDSADDLKGAFTMTGRDIDPIIKVETEIFAAIEKVKISLVEILNAFKSEDMDAKAMAIKFKHHPHFTLIMKLFRGQEINWLEWYKKNYLDDWTLEVVPVN